jgi:hypothetical protein
VREVTQSQFAFVDAGAQARTAGLTLWLLTGGLDGMATVGVEARQP